MSAFLNFLGGLVSPVTNLIDSLVTTDDEKAKARATLTKILLDADQALDKSVTERHKSDMTSDSWLSKNIRPASLAFSTVATFLLVYYTIFILPKEDIVLLETWINLLTTILTTQYIFYFGSRGFEKVSKVKNGKG